jgi:glutamate dehydrogenase
VVVDDIDEITTCSSARKYVEQFSNGITIISMYLNPVPNTRAPPIEHSIHQVIKETSLLYCLPNNPFFSARANPDRDHAVQEATYAYVGWIFAQHFCNRLGTSYIALKNCECEVDQMLTGRS